MSNSIFHLFRKHLGILIPYQKQIIEKKIFVNYIIMLSGLSLEKYLFGALEKKYCNFFYFFAVIMFVFFAMGVFGLLMKVLKGGKKSLSSLEFTLISYNLLLTFVSYFTYRLLYSMCIGSTEGFEDKTPCEDANGNPIDCPSNEEAFTPFGK